MKPTLDLTSIPEWAVAPTCPDADLSGRSWTVIAVGPSAAEPARRWEQQITDAGRGEVRVLRVPDVEAGCAAMDDALADARVGWRLMVVGPAEASLRLRAHATRCGVGDDEIVVGSTDVTRRAVHCAHCQTVTTAAVDLEGRLPCAGCARMLVVHYHVSRRMGAHLGYWADAEVTPTSAAR